MSIISSLEFAFYTQTAGLLASRSLEALDCILHVSEAKIHDAETEVRTHGAEALTHEASQN